ncbi:AAEL007784-PA [Aedes aegypti]|uniref:AAEL007784-PA n=2 Tax=Aedes aegypti TaxID=7159 RepID=A0A1S4FHI2_AEDAE|nr:uncharacterized protein LOC5569634 [Aedes aegypti]EAT40498.1 AAEL007784-PA [Aedes aegypti]
MNRNWQQQLIIILSTVIHLATPWYYHCIPGIVPDSAILSDSCSLKDIVVRSDIDAQNVYFPPTNINFFQSNFSSFSPTLGRRLPEEAERVNFYNCVVPKFAIPTKLRSLGLFFSNVVTVFTNYLTENAMEELVVVGAKITSMRFVEVFSNLRYLRIEGNPIQIVNMETFRNLTKLELVHLSGNRIYFFEPVTKHLELPKLVELNLRRNFLVQFDSSLWYSPNLSVLKLHTNFLKSLNVDELHRSFPNLGEVTLGSNLWNCQRLNVIMGSMLIRNISTYVPDAKMGCHSYSHVDYLSLSGLDAISKTKLLVDRLDEASSGYYAELSNTTLLEELQSRSNILGVKIKRMNDTVQRVHSIYGDLKLWMQKRSETHRISDK